MQKPKKAVTIKSFIENSYRSSIHPLSQHTDDLITKKDQSICNLFQDIQDFAERFVCDIIEEAEDSVLGKRSNLVPKEAAIKPHCFANDFVSWPSIEEFTIELGAKKISEYLSSFVLKEEWLYAIFYLSMTRDLCSDFYHYETVWSLPTARFPIVQATASVYFTIEVSRIIPSNCPVTATFCLETNRLNQSPLNADFDDSWLIWILEAKIKHFQRFTF